ncbi:MAG: transcriptional repressor [Anaerolineae bacterium]|nr:transcriptional repressor [Anaerolineae bacterium]
MDVVDSDIAQVLRHAGYRVTRPRMAILSVLQENREYLSPQEIHRRGRERYQGLGLVTVYRTLQILDGLGIARRVHTRDRCHSYALARGDRHYLVCRRCGQVLEFPCDGLVPLVESVRQETGYLIEGHLLEMTGLCSECQSQGGADR